MTQPQPAPLVDLEELEALAKATRTQPGDWFGGDQLCEYVVQFRAHEAAFIAAANPSTVLAIIQELRALRTERSWIRCSERMPEQTERVWFYANERVIKGEYRHDGFSTSAGFAWDGGEVTHWAHRDLEPKRPTPPEAGK